jgi:S-ribosylhomocysteine lyase LuxS involved in autoinducer biosynthesis
VANNSKQTSSRVASVAAATLSNVGSSKIAKSLAASTLSQRGNARQSGAEMEKVAARVLSSERYSTTTKELAASVLSQANRKR